MFFSKRSLWGVSVVFLFAVPTYSIAANRLPFPDGTYASNPKFCKMSRDQAYARSEMAFYDIKGSEISMYESSCMMRDVSVKGNTIKFKQVCESEGESTVDRVTWKKLGPNSFSDQEGRKWIGCGRYVK